MFYLEVDDGFDPENIVIIKSLGDNRYCGCRFSSNNGRLMLEKRRFYQGDFDLPKHDVDGFKYFENFSIEQLNVVGLGDFPLEQFNPMVFTPDDDSEFVFFDDEDDI